MRTGKSPVGWANSWENPSTNGPFFHSHVEFPEGRAQIDWTSQRLMWIPRWITILAYIYLYIKDSKYYLPSANQNFGLCYTYIYGAIYSCILVSHGAKPRYDGKNTNMKQQGSCSRSPNFAGCMYP